MQSSYSGKAMNPDIELLARVCFPKPLYKLFPVRSDIDFWMMIHVWLNFTHIHIGDVCLSVFPLSWRVKLSCVITKSKWTFNKQHLPAPRSNLSSSNFQSFKLHLDRWDQRCNWQHCFLLTADREFIIEKLLKNAPWVKLWFWLDSNKVHLLCLMLQVTFKHFHYLPNKDLSLKVVST